MCDFMQTCNHGSRQINGNVFPHCINRGRNDEGENPFYFLCKRNIIYFFWRGVGGRIAFSTPVLGGNLPRYAIAASCF